jgi:transmembrane sensor
MSRQPALQQQAAECLLCLQDPDSSVNERTVWINWLAASDAHRDAYARMEELWHAPIDVEAVPMPDAAALAADRDDVERPLPLTSLPLSSLRRAQQQGPALSRRMVGTIAASLLLAAVAVWAVLPDTVPPAATQLLHTARGETRTEQLADGSSLVLGAETEIELRFERDARHLVLRNGEALFTVAHDAARPFTVATNDSETRAVGTVFGVRRGAGETTVTVVEGIVTVRPLADRTSPDERRQVARLTRGQQIAVDRRLGSIRTVDPAGATAWIDGRLSYVDAPLREVLADLARYSSKRIQLDSRVGGLRYTGTVFASDIDAWAATLPRIYPGKVIASATEIRVQSN